MEAKRKSKRKLDPTPEPGAVGAGPASASLHPVSLEWSECTKAAFRGQRSRVQHLLQITPVQDNLDNGDTLQAAWAAAAVGEYAVVHDLCTWAAEHWPPAPQTFGAGSLMCNRNVASTTIIVVVAAILTTRAYHLPSRPWVMAKLAATGYDEFLARVQCWLRPPGQVSMRTLCHRAYGFLDSLSNYFPVYPPLLDPTMYDSLFHIIQPLWPTARSSTFFADVMEIAIPARLDVRAETLVSAFVETGLPIHSVYTLDDLAASFWKSTMALWASARIDTFQRVLISYVHEYGATPLSEEQSHHVMVRLMANLDACSMHALRQNGHRFLQVLLETILPPYPYEPRCAEVSKDTIAAWARSDVEKKEILYMFQDTWIARQCALTLQEHCAWKVHRLLSKTPTTFANPWTHSMTKREHRAHVYQTLPMPLLRRHFQYLRREFDPTYEECGDRALTHYFASAPGGE